MLNEVLASQFLEKIREYTECNVNIMNEKGIIIASKTESRIGTFHEIAFRIVHGEEDEITVGENTQFIGVRPGINLAVFHKSKKVGVIGITGDPAKIRPVALLIRMSLEVVLDYEYYKEDHFQRKSLREQFINRTIYGTRTEEDKEKLTTCAQRLGLEEKFARIPILLDFPDERDSAEKILQGLKDYNFISKQDVVGVIRNNKLLFLRHLEDPPLELIKNHKSVIRENMGQILWYLNNHASEWRVYVGSYQSRFSDYHIGYLHTKWLSEYLEKEKNRIYFFYDSVDKYFLSLIPFSDLKGVFRFFSVNFDEKFLGNYREIITILTAANYNLEDAGKKMHIHKNTVAYRLNKVRDALGINPLSYYQDREFVTIFNEYLRRIQE